jgi:hypothetical protein
MTGTAAAGEPPGLVGGEGALDPLPAGWVAGGATQAYATGTDPAAREAGHVGLAVFSGPSPAPSRSEVPFGSVGASRDAVPLRSKRVRLTGLARAEGVTGWAGLWMRIDGDDGALALDNMQSRPIRGTADWKAYEIVLDVDAKAKRIVYGALLEGRGRLWSDPPKLEVVGESVPVTGFGDVSAAHTSGLGGRWTFSGTALSDYTVSADPTVRRGGATSLSLASKPAAHGPWGSDAAQPIDRVFGTALQAFPAKAHRGARVRLSAYVKTEDVKRWAGLWLRVDGVRTSLAFDNMQDRPITGTTDWTRYALDLDVPSAATSIALGVLLVGEGRVWIDDVVFEDVAAAP